MAYSGMLREEDVRRVLADPSYPNRKAMADALGCSKACLYRAAKAMDLIDLSAPDHGPREAFGADVLPEAARQLWQAVLLAMWRCALELVLCKDNQFEVAEAKRWFGSPDFDHVCMLAGVDADQMLARYRAACARSKVAPPKRGKRFNHMERIAA